MDRFLDDLLDPLSFDLDPDLPRFLSFLEVVFLDFSSSESLLEELERDLFFLDPLKTTKIILCQSHKCFFYLSSSLDELSEEESLLFSFLEVLEERPERVRLLFLAAGLKNNIKIDKNLQGSVAVN